MSNENKGACHACEPLGELNRDQANRIGKLNRKVKELEDWKTEALLYIPKVGNNKEKWQLKIETQAERIKELERVIKIIHETYQGTR